MERVLMFPQKEEHDDDDDVVGDDGVTKACF
jgi:hypothetical protein